MLETALTFLIGILGGIAVGLQTPVASAIGRKVGGTGSSFVIHMSGAILSGLLLLREPSRIRQIGTLPPWMFGAGIFGVVLYLTINHTIPRLGATTAVALIILGQLGVGLVIDTLGLFEITPKPLDATRIIAVLLLLAGGYLISR